MGGEDGCEGSVECVREILQLSGKSQGLSKSSGCGNHDCTLRSLFSSIVSVLNRTAKRLCDKRDRAITCILCRDPHLTLMFSGLCKNVCLKESEVKR